MLTHPVTLYWHRADQLGFVVPPSSWVPCKKRPLPFLNVFGMTGPSSNRESNPQILLVSAGSPLLSPFTISRGYWGPIRYQGAPSGAPTPDPHGGFTREFVCGGSLTSGHLFKGSFQGAPSGAPTPDHTYFSSVDNLLYFYRTQHLI